MKEGTTGSNINLQFKSPIYSQIYIERKKTITQKNEWLEYDLHSHTADIGD